MYKILSSFERNNLLAQHKAEPKGIIKDRIKVVLWYDSGWSHEQIAEALFINTYTSKKHLDEYLEENKLNKNSGGSSSKLTFKQTQKLVKHIENNLYLKVEDIINLCQKFFGISYQKSGMIDWLHRQGFQYMKPVKVLPNRNQKSQKDFIDFYQELKEKVNLSEEKEVLLHMDSCHPTMNLKTVCGWMKPQKPHKLICRASSTRVNIAGALNLSTMETLTSQYKTIDTETIVLFLAEIRQHYQNKTIHIVLDNGRYHKTQEVFQYCIENNIKLHFLPPYSPNLNPIERVWKVMNRYARNNIVFNKPKDFRSKLNNFFKETWDKIYQELPSEINDNFRILV